MEEGRFFKEGYLFFLKINKKDWALSNNFEEWVES